MSDQRMSGIEAAQIRALADALAWPGVSREAVIALSLTDAGVLHVQIDHPDDRRTWLAVSVDAEVIPGIGTAPAPRSSDLDGGQR